MKRIAAYLLLVFVVLSLVSCKGEEEKPQEMTSDEVFEATGVEIPLPNGAENAVYAKSGDVAQVTFTYEDTEWVCRAKKTDSSEPQFFFDISSEQTGNGTMEIEDVYFESKFGEDWGCTAWVEQGVAYNVFSEKIDFGVCSSDTVAEAIYNKMHSTGESDGEETYTTSELSGGELFTLYPWKYDDADEYIRICPNGIYTLAGENMHSDGCVYRWQETGDDEIALLDADGNTVKTLTAVKDENYAENFIITLVDNNDQRTLSSSQTALSGTYNCYFNTFCLEEDELTLMETIDSWFTEEQVVSFEQNHLIDFENEYIENIETDTFVEDENGDIVINGYLKLVHYPEMKLWRLTGGSRNNMFIGGTATITAETVFTDNADQAGHKSFAECLEANGGMYGAVTVGDGGIVESIETTEIF